MAVSVFDGDTADTRTFLPQADKLRHQFGLRHVVLVGDRGAPLYLRSDNGPEFVAQALFAWIVEQGIEIVLIDPGKPWQNGATESFNGKFRDECLSLEWFRSRARRRS